jgi:hypothetical protein
VPLFLEKKWVNTLDSIRYRLLPESMGSDRRESGLNLGSLLVAFVISFTVAGSLALGIALAYTSFLALLHAFAHSSHKPTPRLVLATRENPVSGD